MPASWLLIGTNWKLSFQLAIFVCVISNILFTLGSRENFLCEKILDRWDLSPRHSAWSFLIWGYLGYVITIQVLFQLLKKRRNFLCHPLNLFVMTKYNLKISFFQHSPLSQDKHNITIKRNLLVVTNVSMSFVIVAKVSDKAKWSVKTE